MRPERIVGPVLSLGGHTGSLADGTAVFPGRVRGRDVSVDLGYHAARRCALNCLAGIRLAVGSLDGVRSLIRALCFVAAAPDLTDVHLVSSRPSDQFAEVYRADAGVGERATIGPQSLAHDYCFECWMGARVRVVRSCYGPSQSL